MLSGLPLRLRHGSVASVVARIPWPNPLTSNMGLFMNSLHLILEVTDAPMQERPANTPDSIVNLTESFMHEELNPQEAARLRYSAHYKPNLDPSSMTLDANIPGGFDAIASEESHADMSNETEESSIFSALVERLLSRFTFLANDTVIVIEKAGVARFTLKIPKVRYGDETDDDAEVKDTSNASDSRERSRLPVSDSRTLTITGVNISTCSLRPSSEWTSEPPSPADITQLEPTAFDTHAAVSLAEPIAFMATECEDGLQREHSYASDSDIDEDAAPMMSQSLFFHPRRSSPSPSTASSMYESAISETDQNRWRSADMTGSNVSSRIQLENVATGSSSTQRAPYHMNQEAADSPFMTDQPAVERAGDLIFSLGAEPIRILLEKTAGTTRSGTAPAVSSQGPPDQAEVYSEQIITAGRRTSRVTISIGTVALALQASHIRDIIELGDSVTAGGDSIATRPKGRPPTSAATTSAEISVHVRGIVVLLLPRSSDSASYRSPSLGAYFDHPLVPPCLQGAYTRAFIDDISGSFLMRDGDMPASSACVKVADLSVFSFHDTSSPAAYALPILITDCHLPSQYSSQHVHASAPLPGGIPPILELPSFDVADWTNPDQRSESAKLTTWRARASPPTHPRSGVAGLGLSTSPPTAINGIDILSHIQRGLTPSAVVFSTEAQTVKSAQTMASPRSMNVKIVPLHFFLDLGTLEDRTTSGSRDSDLLTFLEECTRRDAIQSAPSLPPSASPKSVSGPVRHSVELQTTPRVRVTDLPVENQGGGGGNMLRRQMIQDLELGFDYLQDVPTPRLVDPPKPNVSPSD
jgi:autophagy-related protein 2